MYRMSTTNDLVTRMGCGNGDTVGRKWGNGKGLREGRDLERFGNLQNRQKTEPLRPKGARPRFCVAPMALGDFGHTDPALTADRSGKPSGSRCRYVDGCFRISAKACSRAESAGLFAMAALFSNDGAMRFSFASLLWLMCELSALWIALCRAAIRSAGKACDRDNWSTYAFATTN